MSRDFDNTKNADLRAKIDEAKRRLPLPDLMSRLGLGGHAKKSAHCPFLAMKISTNRFQYSKATTDSGIGTVLPDAATATRSYY